MSVSVQRRSKRLIYAVLRQCLSTPNASLHEARGYDEWVENRSWIVLAAEKQIGVFMKSFQDTPRFRQRLEGEFSRAL